MYSSGLILLVTICLMTGRSEAEKEELCKSFMEEGTPNNGTDNFPIILSLRHSFLQMEKGVVPGMRYNVSLRKQSEEDFVYFALDTESSNVFENLPPEVNECDGQHQIVVGVILREVTLSFISPEFMNSTLLFFLSASTMNSKQWITSVHSYSVRSDCHYVNPSEDVLLSSEDVIIESSKTILIHSPKNSGLEITLENLLIPEDSTMLIHNITESSVALILSSDKVRHKILTKEDRYLLIDITRCFDCRFRTLIKPIATKYECNTTVKITRGYLELKKLSPPRVCKIIFEAPLFHRVLMKIVNTHASRTLFIHESCNPQMIVLGPLAGVPKEKAWSICNNSSQAQTEFYISDNYLLNVQWDGSLNGIRLQYEFFPLCANRTFGETSSGHFCSPGYPDIFFGCNTSYSINVPFGYSIELQLSVLGVTAGAFCQNSSLEVTTQNVNHSEKLILSVCLDTADGQEDTFNLQTSNNRMDIRIQPKGDLQRKGFCGTYKAIPSNHALVANCPYGWVSGQKFCYKIFQQQSTWINAEEVCQSKSGHLASITDNNLALLIDEIIKNSPMHDSNNAFWIGANDIRYENCYEWSDGQPFDFSYWFPGWENHSWYSLQPSDDGLSQQNCVELRNLFRYPSKGAGITDRYYWNDMNCLVANPFVCQRLKPGVNLESVTVPVCNRTIFLTWEHPNDVLTSPGFANNYPNNIKCQYHISATHGKRIVAFFTDFILEESESCEYDVLILSEGEDEKWRRCGDWQSKIKLLRYISQGNTIDLKFKSDFSHSLKGFRVEFSLLSEQTSQSVLCDNDMFQLRGNNCYLVVNYPETSWTTARQICSEARSKLAVVENSSQVSILDELVRSTYGYMSGIIYWVGAYTSAGNSTWKWVDGSTLNPEHMSISKTDESLNPSCLAIQWKQLRKSNALRWTAKNCNHPGRFICKKPSVVIPEELNKTVSQMKGNLTSVNYPSNYLNDLDYIAEIIGPPNSRVVVTFHYFDLEWQEDCLYDFVLLRTDLNDNGIKLCGEHISDSEFVSKANKAYVSFHSDFSITATGYSASWEIVDLSVCLNRRLFILETTHITSLRYPRSYLNGLECRVTVIASTVIERLLLTIVDLDLDYCTEAFLEVNLDPNESSKKVKLCGNDLLPGTQLMAYGHEAHLFFHANEGNPIGNKRNRGYNVTCQTWEDSSLENTIYLNSKRNGRIYSLNFNHQQPVGLNYTQRIIAPVGYKIHLRAINISHPTNQVPPTCDGSGLAVYDHYAIRRTTFIIWNPCRVTNYDEVDGIWSAMHVLYINGWNFDGSLPSFFFDYAVVKDDLFFNKSLALASDSVDSCKPNPCQHGGRCIRNGTSHHCHCYGQYTGLFCHLTWCEVNICGDNGSCNLTANGWTCDCLPGYTGPHCQQTVTPCSPNPCEPNGVCTPQNGSFLCICAPDYEGAHCEKFSLRIPYKPLSQRMLEEPFWLGLITVFSVLIIILFVYCIKRKFADKIEKFLAEEIERSKYQPSPPATRYSLSSTQPSLTPGNQSPQTNPKSLFNRIRKNSLLSATCSPSPTADREQSRTFSFDDILRRVHSSKRNRTTSNNPTSSGANTSIGPEVSREDAVKKEEEKSRILASLVTSNKESASRRMSLDEFFRMSERKLQLGAKRTNSTLDNVDTEGKRETSFISVPSPKSLRQSFSEIQCIREQSIEYMSSSESLNCEPSTSEIQADVSPQPPYDSRSQDDESIRKSPDSPVGSIQSAILSPTPTEQSIPPSVSIIIDQCDSEAKNDSESDEKNCVGEKGNCESCRPLSPVISRKSSYLEVPHPIPAIHVFSAESDEPQSSCDSTNCSSKQDRGELSSTCKKDFVQPRKFSVDLPMPKILITANMSSCDSDEASPPRTPNPNKSMMYLSPLAVISSSTDRTISESNLSTSGYSSISSPGLSRCNSSSPISDEVDHHHHPNCTRKSDPQSPKKPHGLQMTYLSVGGNDKAFFFPPTIACHCHTPNQSAPVVFEPKNSSAVPTVWTPGKHRLLYKRNSYQTTSTDDSIDDEGIGMDAIDFKIRKGELRSARDLEMFIAAENIPSSQDIPPPLFMESNKPDLLACSVNKQPGNSISFKGSPRTGIRKGEKIKKYSDKHRRSPIISPASTPVKDHSDSTEARIPRNSSRTSMSGTLVSSSESDDPEGHLGTRQKNQNRRSKRQHEISASGHKQSLVSMASQDSNGPKTDKSSDATGRSSPQSESNGDSAPMDSRSPASSSSESLPSTRDSTLSEKTFCNRHKFTPEYARSFPPQGQDYCLEGKAAMSKIDFKRSLKPPIIQFDSEEELARSSEEHPCLKRQEAVVEDDPSDDSSSETTVLLRRPPESPRNLQASSSAEVSEWEAFSKE